MHNADVEILLQDCELLLGSKQSVDKIVTSLTYCLYQNVCVVGQVDGTISRDCTENTDCIADLLQLRAVQEDEPRIQGFAEVVVIYTMDHYCLANLVVVPSDCLLICC